MQHLLDHGLSLWSLDGNLSVVVGLVVELQVVALEVRLHPFHVLVDVGGVDDEEEVVLGHLVDQQVVYGAAVGVAHHAIEDFPYGRTGDVVGEDMVHVALGVGALDAHLAHV